MGTDQAPAGMTKAGKRNRDLAVVFAAVTHLYGFAGNFFAHFWTGWVIAVSYLVNVVLLTGLSGVVVGRDRGSSLLVLAGALMAGWSLVGTLWEIGAAIELVDRPSARPPLNFPQPPPLLGAFIPTLTGFLTATFAYRWRAAST